ncbi:hypothetical protein D3C78_1351900 [compost metagenome]
MNLFSATLKDEQAAIGTLPWYKTVVPLIQPHFPTGTDISPTLTCKEFLQLIMGLPADLRARILNTEIPDVAEEIEEVKRSGHKTLLVGICGVLLLAAVLITGGYIAMTSSQGGTVDKEVMDGFFKFLWLIVKLVAAIFGVEIGGEETGL